NHLLAGVTAGRLGNRHPTIAPYATYHASDGPFALGVGNDKMFTRLCAAIGRPELATDERFATNAARREHYDALDAELEVILAGRHGRDRKTRSPSVTRATSRAEDRRRERSSARDARSLVRRLDGQRTAATAGAGLGQRLVGLAQDRLRLGRVGQRLGVGLLE